MNKDQRNTPSIVSLIIEPFREEHIEPSIYLWTSQYKTAKKFHTIPDNWGADSTSIREYLEEHAKTGKGIVAKTNGEIVGYMVYDKFPFHGAEIIYSSIVGHSSVESGKEKIYQKMYKYLSDIWVKNNVLDHIITFFSHEIQLKEALFNLGFGLYAVDLYRSVNPIDHVDSVSIQQASLDDADDIMRLGEEFGSYCLEAPLFFVRDNKKRQYYEDYLRDKDSAVFLAKHDGDIVGFMSIRKNCKDDIFTLADKNTGRIDMLGAYIQPFYRSQGIGVSLLSCVLQWCYEMGIDFVHVDYESANLYASGFWPTHFVSTMFSVKRRVNPDILSQML